MHYYNCTLVGGVGLVGVLRCGRSDATDRDFLSPVPAIAGAKYLALRLARCTIGKGEGGPTLFSLNESSPLYAVLYDGRHFETEVKRACHW